MKTNSVDILLKVTEKPIWKRLILENKAINNYEHI